METKNENRPSVGKFLVCAAKFSASPDVEIEHIEDIFCHRHSDGDIEITESLVQDYAIKVQKSDDAVNRVTIFVPNSFPKWEEKNRKVAVFDAMFESLILLNTEGFTGPIGILHQKKEEILKRIHRN